MRFTFVLTLSLFTAGLMAQNLKTFKTWYDPYTQTTIHEVYTTLTSPPYLKQGIYKEYDQYGNLIMEIVFANGKKNGPSKTYYTTGLVSTFGYLKSAIGKLYTVSNYKQGELHGQEIMYSFSSGQHLKSFEKTWENGVQTKQVDYYENGIKKSDLMVTGPCYNYYPSGKIDSKYYSKNGSMNGRFTSWHPNGTIAVKAKYKDDNYIDTLQTFTNKGLLQGMMIFDPTTLMLRYHQELSTDGKIQIERKISGNDTYKTNEYDTISGKVIASYSEIYDGKSEIVKHGLYTSYQDGIKKTEVSYQNGKKNGDYKVYDDKSRIITSGVYQQEQKSGSWKFFYDSHFTPVTDLDSATCYRLIEFSRDKPIGKVKDHYMTDTLRWVGELLSVDPDIQDGYSIYYYPNGQKGLEGNYKRGEQTGEWKSYKEDGSFLETQTF